MMSTSADRPISSKEEDRYGFLFHAQAIASCMRDEQGYHSVVYGLSGEWGSGKTSFINLLKNELNSSDIKMIDFNPWWHSSQDDLLKYFFDSLSKGLILPDNSPAKRALLYLSKHYSRNFGFIEIISDLYLPGIAGRILKQLNVKSKELNDKKYDVEKARHDISTALRSDNKKYYVFIDDVDRLSAKQIRSLFTMLKSVADLSNIIYFVTYDKQYVGELLSSSGLKEDYDWDQKIVQVYIDIPTVIESDILEEVYRRTSDLGHSELDKTSALQLKREIKAFVSPYIKRPRDIIRLFNSITARYALVKNYVYLPDFIGVECIRIFKPDLYEIIKSSYSDLVFIEPGMKGGKNQFAEEANRICTQSEFSSLRQLFPRIAIGHPTHEFRGLVGQSHFTKMRISVAHYFSFYIGTGIPLSYPLKEDVDLFLDSLQNDYLFYNLAINYKSIKAYEGTKLKNTFYSAHYQSLSKTSFPHRLFIYKLMLYSDMILDNYDFQMAKFMLAAEISHIAKYHLSKLDISTRVSVVNDIVMNCKEKFCVLFLIKSLVGEHGGHEDHEEVAPKNRILEKNQADYQYNKIIDKIIEATAGDDLYHEKGLLWMLGEAKKHKPDIDLDKLTSDSLIKPENAIAVAKSCISEATYTQSTMSFPETEENVDVEKLDGLINVITMRTAINSVLSDPSYDDDMRRVALNFDEACVNGNRMKHAEKL